MNKPCWKAVNAQIRKKKAEQKKTEERIHKEKIESWNNGIRFNEESVYRNVTRIKAECVVNSIDKYRMPFEERMDYAKRVMFNRMYEQITSAWVLEHNKDFCMDTEKWRAELRVVKGGYYL